MVLAPSAGFGGGIERVASAVEDCWQGPCRRVDLYRAGRQDSAAGAPLTKAGFAARSLSTSVSWRPDIVLALHIGLLPVAAIAAGVLRARVALVGIGTEVWAPLSSGTRRLVGRCAHVLAISTFTAAVFAQCAQIDVRRIRVVPLPVDDTLLARARDAGTTPDPLPLLLTVSRITRQHRYKGHFAIAESLPLVLATRPEARWFVVGGGDDVTVLQRRCYELGIGHAVSFEGVVTDSRLAELYACAAALVLPSVADADARPPIGEGLGLVYAEAGAFGVPSIAATAGGGSADLVRDGVTGLTADPEDRDELAEAMLRLLNDRGLRDELGSAARSQVLARHTPQRFAEALGNALQAGPP